MINSCDNYLDTRRRPVLIHALATQMSVREGQRRLTRIRPPASSARTNPKTSMFDVGSVSD